MAIDITQIMDIMATDITQIIYGIAHWLMRKIVILGFMGTKEFSRKISELNFPS